MTENARGGSRWTLSDAEQRWLALRKTSLTALQAGQMLLRSPRLAWQIARMASRAAIEGVSNDSGLVWTLDSARVRVLIPDAASGASWTDEAVFLRPLLPLLTPTMRVLEIGCGAGRIARHVAPHVRELVCADVSNILLDEARAHLAIHTNVRFLCTRGFTLDALDTGAFDLVYALGVFSFFDPNQALALLDEVCRLLAPTGMSAINFFTIDQPPWAAHAVTEARRLARRRIFHAGVARPYTAEQIAAWHAAVGLRIVDRQRGDEVPGGPRVPCLFIAAQDAGPDTGPRSNEG